MKALSLIQPWATLIAIGAKRIETRSWPTRFRGQVAIHASKWKTPNGRVLSSVEACLALCLEDPFRSVLKAAGIQKLGDLPSGAIVAVATLTACEKTETIRQIAADAGGLLPHELEFGDYSDGRYGFTLSRVIRLAVPVQCRGSLGFWDVPADVEQQVRETRVAE